jgi:hypothetical protein
MTETDREATHRMEDVVVLEPSRPCVTATSREEVTLDPVPQVLDLIERVVRVLWMVDGMPGTLGRETEPIGMTDSMYTRSDVVQSIGSMCSSAKNKFQKRSRWSFDDSHAILCCGGCVPGCLSAILERRGVPGGFTTMLYLGNNYTR